MDVFATTFAPSLGLLATNAMYVAPLTAVLAARERGAMPMNALPFAAQLLNTGLWCFFAVARQDFFIFLSNAPGFVLALFFITSALPLLDSVKRAQLERAALCAATALASIAFAAGLLLAAEPAEQLLGVVAGFGATAFYLAPLSVASDVLRTRNAASLSAPLSAATLANATLWAVYGAAVKSPAVLLPNLVGVATAFASLALISRFGSRPVVAGLAASGGGKDSDGGGDAITI